MSAQNDLVKKHMTLLLCVLLACSVCKAHAFRWQDLMLTPDQQAETLMKAGDFVKAQQLFQQQDWRAVAAYRAGDYKQAAKEFEKLPTEQGFYNGGNALAKMEKYEDAIKAYDKALALNPSNQDALYNRKLIAELLKKKQEQQNKDNQSKDKESQDKGSDNKSKQDKDKSSQDAQNQDNSEKQNTNEDLKQKDKNEQAKGLENDKKQGKKDATKDQPGTDSSSQETREKQQAKEQWLQLIPDDPGGLMREKFLRDYLRRQRGWNQ